LSYWPVVIARREFLAFLAFLAFLVFLVFLVLIPAALPATRHS